MNKEKLIEISDDLLNRLFPICRSVTGDGVRETLNIVREYCPEFVIHEYPSGTKVFDWTIPKEWNIQDAYIKDSSGNRIIDFKKHNLHVMSYSIPVHKNMNFAELLPHIHTLPNLPDAIPYRTSYYEENWAFCMTQKQYEAMNKDEVYEVKIDSKLKDGFLTLAEAVLPGRKKDEILISTYCCHPSMANDNLSGIILTALLLNELKDRNLEYSYRFIIVPETIGAITYLAHNEEVMGGILGGFVVATVGGPGKFGYKQTFLGNHEIDRLVRLTFKEFNIENIEYPFVPDGSDERQYSSPGFRIPVGTVCKDKYYEYEYYHTSLDNLDFVRSENLVSTLELYISVIEKLEMNRTYKTLNPFCEVQLGKRGLYPQTGGSINQMAVARNVENIKNHHMKVSFADEVDALSWILFFADGTNSLLDIAEKTKIPFEQLVQLTEKLKRENLLEEVPS